MIERFRRKRDLTIGSISKNLWILALPMIITNIFESAFNLVDMFWVGKLGPEALAAVSMSGMVLMVVFFLLIGMGMGTIAIIARYIGAKNVEGANNVATQFLILATFLSVVLGIIGYFLSPYILSALGANPTVLSLGTSYIQILLSCVVVMVYAFFISAILQGAGDAFTPMIILGIATLINLVLDPFLIFGWGPFPVMGVNGAAWASVIGRAFASMLALYIIFSGRSHIKVRFKKPDFSIMWRILKIGIPASTQNVLRGLMGVIMITVVAGFGTTAVAAYGVCIRLIMIVMMPGFAIAASAATLVGQNLGGKNPDRSKQSAWIAFYFYGGFMIFMSVMFVSFAPQLIGLFSSNTSVIEIGSDFLRIYSLGFIFIAFGLIFSRSLAGAGDTIAPLIIVFISLWVIQIPLAFYLAYKTSFGVSGVWYAMLLATFLQGILSLGWFQTGRWKHKKV